MIAPPKLNLPQDSSKTHSPAGATSMGEAVETKGAARQDDTDPLAVEFSGKVSLLFQSFRCTVYQTI